MNKILYDDGNLIIISEYNVVLRVIPSMALGLQKTHHAQAIYIKKGDVLYPVKYRSPQALNEFCKKHNINMYRTGRFEKEGHPSHMFATAKDQFLFELKFGT